MGRVISIERHTTLRRLDDAMDVSAVLMDWRDALKRDLTRAEAAIAAQARVNSYLESIEYPGSNTAA